MKTIKRKKSVRVDRTSVQRPLSTFLEEKKEEYEEEKEEYEEEKEEYEDKIDKVKEIEIRKEIIEDKIIEKRLPNQIETDYYEQNCIEACAKGLRERFGIINIEITPVRFNQKIYGYYILITVRDRDKDTITKFIKEECGLKVY